MWQVCANTSNWSSKYGISASKTGLNLLVGPGIPESDDDVKHDTAVMAQTTHSNEMGRQIGLECHRHLIGAEDDDEISPLISQAMADDADPFVALRGVVCDSPAGACGKAALAKGDKIAPPKDLVQEAKKKVKSKKKRKA